MTTETNSVLNTVKEAFAPVTEAFTKLQNMEVPEAAREFVKKQADAALKLVADADTAAGIEVRGDAHLALGQKEQARTAYAEAMAKLDVASPHRRLLELKLTEVGGTPAKPEAKS